MENQQRKPRLVIFSIIFLLLLTYPLISIFNKKGTVAGIPKLYFYCFFLWISFILLVRWISDKNITHKDKTPNE